MHRLYLIDEFISESLYCSGLYNGNCCILNVVCMDDRGSGSPPSFTSQVFVSKHTILVFFSQRWWANSSSGTRRNSLGLNRTKSRSKLGFTAHLLSTKCLFGNLPSFPSFVRCWVSNSSGTRRNSLGLNRTKSRSRLGFTAHLLSSKCLFGNLPSFPSFVRCWVSNSSGTRRNSLGLKVLCSY